jgi:hypothetical protein
MRSSSAPAPTDGDERHHPHRGGLCAAGAADRQELTLETGATAHRRSGKSPSDEFTGIAVEVSAQPVLAG